MKAIATALPLAGLLLAAVLAAKTYADDKPPALDKPLSLLFIGNSYTSVNALPGIVEKMAVSAGRAKPLVAESTPGGCTLSKQMQTPRTLELIDQGGAASAGWDVVVLQEQSQLPAMAAVNPQVGRTFLEGATALYQKIREKNRSARVVLYETWSRHAEVWTKKPAEVQPLGASPLEMQSRIRKSYQAVAAELARGDKRKVAIAPVGDIWEIVYRSEEPVRLHADDGSHPNPAGSYVAGLVLFATIYATSPAKVTYVVPGLSEADAGVLKKLLVQQWDATAKAKAPRSKKAKSGASR